MGLSQICTTNTTADNRNLFDQAESVAFQHVNANLRDMPGCCLGDLAQAAKSYFFQSVWASGAAHLFREEYVERKAERSAAWWHRKHRDIRTPRPHSKYSPAQALRGRQVAAIRKKTRNDWTALRVQLARQGGLQVAAIAEQLGCSDRSIFRLSKRKFPRIVVAVLCQFFGLTLRKNSVGPVSQNRGTGQKESLRTVSLDDVRPAAPPPEDENDEIDALGARIGDILRAWWASKDT